MPASRLPFVIVNKRTGEVEVRCSCCEHPHLLYVRREHVIELQCRHGKQVYVVALETLLSGLSSPRQN